MVCKIGVLALQGAFAKHRAMLDTIGVSSMEIRYPHELNQCDGLILPGGESTTMTRQIKEMGFISPLKEFAAHQPLFGTCAGMILMAREGILGLVDITVSRNAYGRQCDSFLTTVKLSFSEKTIDAVFIRAPRITAIHSSDVQTLADRDGEPLLVQQGFHLAAAFHPELTNDPAIHKYFLQLCIQEKQSLRHPSPTTPTRSFQMT